MKTKQEILNDFDKWCREDDINLNDFLDILHKRMIVDFISQELAEQRKEMIKKMIELSDKIERGYQQTEFDEWRAFKGFRNTLRDKLEKIKEL